MLHKNSFQYLFICSLIILLSWNHLKSSAYGQTSFKSFEFTQTKQLIYSLLKEQRYQEAVTFLNHKLEILSPSASRLPLMLLLAEAQLEAGDLSGARATISEANLLTVSREEEWKLETQKRRLEKYEQKTQKAAVGEHKKRRSLIKEAEAAEAAEAEITPLKSIRVTNSFFEMDLRQVLIDLSMDTGIPLLWDATVWGLVTYECEDKILEEVLEAILLPAGFTYTFRDGTCFIGSSKPEDPSFGLLSKTSVVTLSNIPAEEAVELLSEFFEPYVKANSTTNMVCITAPSHVIKRVEEDLTLIDAPQEQILIEAVITEISADALREIGLDWMLTPSVTEPGWDVGTSYGIEDAPFFGDYLEQGIKIGRDHVDLAASLNALIQSGDAKIRANPRISTLNGRKAEISLTKDQYFVIQTGASQFYAYNTLQAISTGITLEIVPYVSDSGDITVYVNPVVGDVVGEGTGGLPEISTRSASTSVRVMDGETFTIGGLSLQQENSTKKKVPLFGDIPLLGYLFRYEKIIIKDTEIIIFITPHILKG